MECNVRVQRWSPAGHMLVVPSNQPCSSSINHRVGGGAFYPHLIRFAGKALAFYRDIVNKRTQQTSSYAPLVHHLRAAAALFLAEPVLAHFHDDTLWSWSDGVTSPKPSAPSWLPLFCCFECVRVCSLSHTPKPTWVNFGLDLIFTITPPEVFHT